MIGESPQAGPAAIRIGMVFTTLADGNFSKLLKTGTSDILVESCQSEVQFITTSIAITIALSNKDYVLLILTSKAAHE